MSSTPAEAEESPEKGEIVYFYEKSRFQKKLIFPVVFQACAVAFMGFIFFILVSSEEYFHSQLMIGISIFSLLPFTAFSYLLRYSLPAIIPGGSVLKITDKIIYYKAVNGKIFIAKLQNTQKISPSLHRITGAISTPKSIYLLYNKNDIVEKFIIHDLFPTKIEKITEIINDSIGKLKDER